MSNRSTPEVTVVIPIYAAGPDAVALLRHALERLNASTFQGYEVWVGDDASPAGEAVRAATIELGGSIVRLDRRRGPAAARNAAARKAKAPILAFFDADTAVHEDTLERLERALRENPGLDAVMGSYDREPAAPGVVSRFRNLLHSYVHHRANRRAWTFWAACSAVRRDKFLALGGFDEHFPRPSIEDVEFGMRLCAAGGAIELDSRIQVKHHKRWTLASMVYTDLFARAIPWTLLLRRHPVPFDLNFKLSDRLAVLLIATTAALMMVAPVAGGGWWLAPAATLVAIAILYFPLYRFLARATSRGEALLCFPLLLIYLATCATGLIAGSVLSIRARKRHCPT